MRQIINIADKPSEHQQVKQDFGYLKKSI